MIMSLRWFGTKYDQVPLNYIRQIPGVTGIISSLHGVDAGEIFTLSDLENLKNEVNKSGLSLVGIESLNVHEDIKLGLPTKDLYISNYIESLKNIKKAGLELVVYNFMPVFDWTRTNMAKVREDGATALSYDHKEIETTTPVKFMQALSSQAPEYVLPGWEPAKFLAVDSIIKKYQNISREDLFNNLSYFLSKVVPVCEELDLKLAIHPDDPAWEFFGLPRINTNLEDIQKIMNLYPSPNSGIAFCTGSYGSNPNNDVPEMIRQLGNKIFFVHIRNVKYNGEKSFEESAHLTTDGSLNMREIVKALLDVNFAGPIRPDHGRMIFGETGRPGYGLYDRALGAAYVLGLIEGLKK